MKSRVGIAGFRGYSGEELVGLLARHPSAEPVLLEHRADGGVKLAPMDRRGPARVACTPEAARDAGLDAVFLATPVEVSLELAPALLAAGLRVIDLSGAFRLGDVETYNQWYSEPHTAPELLREAVYGLPEFCRARIAGAQFVANPGCYPTAANLALRPLLRAGVVDLRTGVVCDAKSGVSGAGRKPSLKTSFCEVTDNFIAYAVLEHRHVPEVLMISGLSGAQFSFTAQLIPIARGILETIYFRLNGPEGVDRLLSVYRDAYEKEPFVRLYPPGESPDVHAVAHTNFCDIGFHVHALSGRAVVVAAIDNLVKGAAGQAIQNMNLMLGFPETAGLL